METPGRSKKIIAGLVTIALIGAATAGVIAINRGETTQTGTASQSQQTTPTESSQNSSSTTSTSGSYKDGTYTATGSYQTPGGTESIGLTVTFTGGVISSSSLEQNADSGESRSYQSRFASGYSSLVVGKNIDSVSLSRVAGSSLTSAGFNRALEQIKSDASS